MTTTYIRPTDLTLKPAIRVAMLFAAIKLFITFALTLYTQHLGYSYFRDEFYYIACGQHLAWGYVDHGPIAALQARIATSLFGTSLFAIRSLSALGGALMVFLCGLVCWSLGGRHSAQALGMMTLIMVPQFIGLDGYLSMNSWEPVFWTCCILAITRIARGSSPLKWWTLFGISAGIGLLNKPSMTFFLLALGVGLLLTPQRKLLFNRYAALGIVLLLLIALPNVLWQTHHHWPTLEFLQNGRNRNKNVVLGPFQFFLAQFSAQHPVAIFVWLAGVVALLRAKSIPAISRWLGITYIVFFVMMFAIHAKDYYLAGIYPAFFAAGAIAWEHRFRSSPAVRRGSLFAFPIYESILLVTTILILPMASPVLAPTTWVRYTSAMHLKSTNTETAKTGPLPQFYADRFGWQHEADVVASAFHSLSPEEQKRVCIFAGNYGEAGAVDFFNRRDHLGLPPASSGQNSYWSWGMHGCDINRVIAIVDDTPQELAMKYASVQIVGIMGGPYSMPFERHNIYLLHDRKSTAPFNWADERFYF